MTTGTTDPWRVRCPRGHAAVRERWNKWYCTTCRDPRSGDDHDGYHDHAIDAKTGDRL